MSLVVQAWAGLPAATSAAAAAALLLRVDRMPALLVNPSLAGGENPAMRRYRGPISLLAGCGVAILVGGPAAPALGLLGAVAAWVVAGRSEPESVRRRREQARRELPALVGLIASALHGGADPATAVDVVTRAFPGPAADRLGGAAARLALGLPPETVWTAVSGDAVLAPLGRAMTRAYRSGTPVATSIEVLAAELARDARAVAEDRARSVGVRAALPLGLCLLPAFVVLGIVPVVAGLVGPLLSS